jgi:diguanylate cyclase (GGDEF)-like protein
MIPARRPENEAERLAALRSYAVLDTVCETAFDNIAELAAMLTRSPIALVSLVDADRQWFKSHIGLEAAETPRDNSFCAHAILTPDRPLIVPDALNDARFANNPLVTGEPGIRFYAGVPLVNGEGVALGTLCVIDRQPRDMTETEQVILTRLAENVMTTLELRRTTSQVHRFAMLDYLTGLPNRPAMIEAIERAIVNQERHGESFSLLYMDLDGFKPLNDRLGHAVGDAVLREVAAAFQAVTRGEELAARLGGDEFALLVAGCEGVAAGERVRAELNTRMQSQGWQVTPSIGVVWVPHPPPSVEAALSAADALMYKAKASGKNRTIGGSFDYAPADRGRCQAATPADRRDWVVAAPEAA